MLELESCRQHARPGRGGGIAKMKLRVVGRARLRDSGFGRCSY